MKKWKPGLILAAAAAVCATAIFVRAGRRPFRALEAGQIASATVTLTPPDRTLRIDDREALAALLREAVTYRRDDGWQESCGQGVTFSLTMADGTARTVMAYNPFLVIDGVGYRTEYGPCEALSAFANELLRQPDAPAVWTEPPALLAASGDTNLGALRLAYNWTYDTGDGTWAGQITDAPHPLDPVVWRDLEPLDAAEPVRLEFQAAPDRLQVLCWPASAVGRIEEEGTALAVDDAAFTPLAGEYLYEVTAWWDSQATCRGQASYVLRLVG